MSKKIILALAALTLVAAPALAQNRFQSESRANAERRDENKSVREAEHPADPAPTQTAAAPAPAAPAPAAPAAAPAAPAAPATAPAAAPTAPAPAQ